MIWFKDYLSATPHVGEIEIKRANHNWLISKRKDVYNVRTKNRCRAGW